MTRRRLWSVTAVACLLLALPGVPSSWRSRALDVVAAAARASAAAAVTAAVSAGESSLRRLPPPDPRAGPIALAAGSLLLGTVLLVRRRRMPATERATRLARRGRSVPAIARATGLSQDAVRDLLGGDPGVVSSAVEGRFCRRARRAQVAPTATFADELRERSFDATA